MFLGITQSWNCSWLEISRIEWWDGGDASQI